MSLRNRPESPTDESQEACDSPGGISSFIKSLLSGVPWSESAAKQEVLVLEAPVSRALRVQNSNGRTEIIGEDRSDIEVSIAKIARAESEAAAGRMLEEIRVVSDDLSGPLELDVVIPKKWNRHGTANLQLKIPRDLEVAVSASNGKLCFRGLRNGVNARSNNGSVSIADVVGNIDVLTANAPVCCTCTCGRLVARSSNGKIVLGNHSGSLDASTSNGLIKASVTQLGEGGVLLATSNGRIALELPDDVDAEVDIRVENGIIRNHREVDDQIKPVQGRVRGRLGKGGTPIKLRTSNGVISLH